jgi:hypothetical protein
MGIDVRRFLSFGLIKVRVEFDCHHYSGFSCFFQGFIRRVHRYPMLLSESDILQASIEAPRSPDTRVNNSFVFPGFNQQATHPQPPVVQISATSPRSADDMLLAPKFSIPPERHSQVLGHSRRTSSAERSTLQPDVATPSRRLSAAAQALERVFHQSRSSSPAPPNTSPPSPLISRATRPRGLSHDEHVQSLGRTPSSQRRPLITPSSLLPLPNIDSPSAPRRDQHRRRSGSDNLGRPLGQTSPFRENGRRSSSRPPSRERRGGGMPSSHALTSSRVSAIPSLYRASSVTTSRETSGFVQPAMEPSYPKDLALLLSGEHHTDELCTKFEASWPRLEQWLTEIGGGQGEGDLGRVVILYK